MRPAILAGFVCAGVLSAQIQFTAGPALDAAIEQAVKDDQIPGAVLMIGHNGQIVYQKAYGYRALVPRKEAMTMDTIFDAASLTKVVATTSCVMKLVEEGKLRLADKVTQYLPEYQAGRSDITLKQLLTHFSGLRPDLDLRPEWHGYETGIQKALIDKPASPPGVQFVYSDINFILLGEIVRRVSHQPLPAYAHEKIFGPLGMKETMFLPPASLVGRIAPTEVVTAGGAPLRGVVHDETTRFMGGVAGHAGLFTTAADLARFATMMLGMGEREGVRIFSPLAVRTFTSPQTPADQPVLRGFGWDISSPFSGNRGELFPLGSYGHTGFTGTSLWMDPATNSFVILLANSVHPNRRPPITSLRGRVASMAAAGLNVDIAPGSVVLSQRPPAVRTAARNAEVLTGLDVLAEEGFQSLKGKRVGLITNHTGLSRDGRRNIDLMLSAGVNLKALFSPEHGILGKEDHENVANAKDEKSGLPVHSLYLGANRRPSDDTLRDLDVLVFDIQDVGARFYTYTCTMANAMEEAARRKLPFIVLDRPNPITGTHVEGPVLERNLKSFIGCYEMPVRHGMTMGELAQMLNDDFHPKAELRVVAMKNWQRGDWFDSTGLPWVNPSPNMRSLNAALLYPGIGMLEGGKVYSVGRGTDAPFEQIGAEWIRGRELAAYLNARQIPGIRVYATQFQPASSNFSGKTIEGVRFVITDRQAFSSTGFGLELGVALSKLFPGKMNWTADEKLTGNPTILKAMEEGEDPAVISQKIQPGLLRFLQHRKNYLLY
ncbi:MAG: exo-beta-N-acetylmuramidase NamZ domain-containing protein [Bryobacteraceae bacterium]